MNKIYKAEVFDSKNTAITQTVDFFKTKKDFVKWAIAFSRQPKVHHIIIYCAGAWNQYQDGQLTAYSYPRGI